MIKRPEEIIMEQLGVSKRVVGNLFEGYSNEQKKCDLATIVTELRQKGYDAEQVYRIITQPSFTDPIQNFPCSVTIYLRLEDIYDLDTLRNIASLAIQF